MTGLALGLAVASAQAGNQKELISGASGKMLAAQCDGCHGPNGASGGPAIPNIGGISKDYMIEVMKGFKSGEVPSTIMGRIAKGYSDDEIERLANHYASLKWVPAKQSFDAAMAKEGAKLHEKYCEKCHEDGGKKAEEDAAILAGQWMPYLQFTMSDFLSGKREMTKKMKKKVKKLLDSKGEKGLQSIVHFYASQQ
ncbi:c-type cytochrome [Thermopetrobacter sp. TC1]|uniref:c-type cytochrome n=1 Tax=Thermopetrobacter sp. TC1 TaxID=1495045 RepID=UPI0012E05E27|nr:c-type cytochrome [Thermopetrobacter sp. TC1]